jgi:hypothetical protein
MRARLIACLVMVIALPVSAVEPASNEEIAAWTDAAFAKGVEHKTHIFEAPKHFAEAANGYRKLHDRRVRSPALYANFGNAAVLANRWPEAIWAYQLGLKLDPNDAAMREHLAFARAKVIYPPAGQGRLAADTWPIWLHRPTVNELWIIAGLSYIMACLGATIAFFRRTPWPILLTVTFAAAAIVAGMGLWYEERQAEIDRQTPVVVLTSNTEFYRGNGVSYPQHPVLPVLPRGLEVRQLHRRGQWLQVRLTTGEIGWVSRSQCLVVE